MADIYINISNETKNIVRITPFSDSDKPIAQTLEKALNKYLMYEGELDSKQENCFTQLTTGI